MRLKFVFCLFSLCCLLSVNAYSNVLNNGTEISLKGSDVYFEIPKGSDGGSRSAAPAIPILAYQDGNQISLDFLAPVGEIEIIISQDGAPVYSSSEDIQSPILKGIQLSQESGTFLIEIKGANGAYAYGWFTL